MKTKYLSVLPLLFAALFITGCAGDEMPQQPNGGGTKGNTATATTTFTGETQVPATVGANTASLTTRTAGTHAIGNGAAVTWTATDKIWVKDDNGTYRQSNAVVFPDASNKAKGVFNFALSNCTGSSHTVVYTNGNTAGKVNIKSRQMQSSHNNFDHLGASGDCGVATATGSTGSYKFTLEHKAAYLCFYPRIQNDVLHKNVKLDKIVLKSTSGPIASTYDFAEGTLGDAPAGNPSNTITLNTFNGKIPSVTHSDTCYYMVIAPGSHALTAEYHITDPETHISETVIRDLGTLTLVAGKMTDVTAWIDRDIKDYSEWQYYMWDAQKPYWFGHEWNNPDPSLRHQSIFNGISGSHYPQSKTDDPDRWHNEAYNDGHAINAGITPLFTQLPNANEMSWYCMKGDPRWDADKPWTTMGHLYKGGVWLKKIDRIAADENNQTVEQLQEKSALGNDMRIEMHKCGNSAIPNLPLASEQDDYFFLPFLGYYAAGDLRYLGTEGYYWSSSGDPTSTTLAYSMYFKDHNVYVRYDDSRILGDTAIPFE